MPVFRASGSSGPDGDFLYGSPRQSWPAGGSSGPGWGVCAGAVRTIWHSSGSFSGGFGINFQKKETISWGVWQKHPPGSLWADPGKARGNEDRPGASSEWQCGDTPVEPGKRDRTDRTGRDPACQREVHPSAALPGPKWDRGSPETKGAGVLHGRYQRRYRVYTQ